MHEVAPRGSTTDGFVVIRLWQEHHDPRVRARLLVEVTTDTGLPEPLIGVEQILAAVAEAIRRFEEPCSDADATLPRRQR